MKSQEDINSNEESKNNNIETNDAVMNKQNELEADILVSEEDNYTFGWSKYSEITNGRFAMLGLLAIIVIELISKRSFLDWSGIIN